MSEQNLELVARGYAVGNSRDLEGALEMVSSDFEFWPMVGFPGVEEVYRGDGWRRFAEMFWDAWETVEITVDRLEDLGDQVLALVTFDGVGRSSGVNVKLSAGHLWSMRDGLVARLDAYEPGEALKAAGLAEKPSSAALVEKQHSRMRPKRGRSPLGECERQKRYGVRSVSSS